MEYKSFLSRRARIDFNITQFEVPPMQDLLIIGKKAAIGPEAARRMAEAVAPGLFEIIRIEHPRIEAVLVRKSIFEIINQEKMMEIILEESGRLINESMVLRSEIKISVNVQREVDLS